MMLKNSTALQSLQGKAFRKEEGELFGGEVSLAVTQPLLLMNTEHDISNATLIPTGPMLRQVKRQWGLYGNSTFSSLPSYRAGDMVGSQGPGNWQAKGLAFLYGMHVHDRGAH